MNLPVCRIRQVVRVIEKRQKFEMIRRDMITEWQTKTLAGFIAGTVKVQKGKQNPLAKAVDKIKLVSQDDLEDIGASSSPETTDPRAYDPAVFVEEGSQLADNKVASFERLMQGMRQ